MEEKVKKYRYCLSYPNFPDPGRKLQETTSQYKSLKLILEKKVTSYKTKELPPQGKKEKITKQKYFLCKLIVFIDRTFSCCPSNTKKSQVSLNGHWLYFFALDKPPLYLYKYLPSITVYAWLIVLLARIVHLFIL